MNTLIKRIDKWTRELATGVPKESSFKILSDCRAELLRLSGGGWVPCAERMPDKDGEYLVTFTTEQLPGGHTTTANLRDGEWTWDDEHGVPERCWNPIVAWRELPSPFQPVAEQKTSTGE